MVQVYYANIADVNYQELYQLVPTFRRKKADKYVHHIDRVRSVAAFYLVMKLLKVNHIPCPDNLFKVDKKTGKPYLLNNPIYFNLSHSGNYVIAALSNKPVGVDVEMMDKKVILQLKKYVLTEEEMKKCRTKKDFYLIWCQKESYAKLKGEGLGIDFSRLNLKQPPVNKFTFKTFVEDKHVFSICSFDKIIAQIKKINL